MSTKAPKRIAPTPTGVKTARKRSVDKNAVATAIGYLSAFHPISKGAIQHVGTCVTEHHLKKGEILQHAGIIAPNLYFVVKGILRGYIVDNKKVVTTWITSENQLIASIRSFMLQAPTLENIEALEDCQLLCLHYTDLQYLYDHFPDFNSLGRKIVEYYYAFAEDRAFICRLSNASQRYEYFMKDNSHLINRIPLMYIASYL